MNCFVKHFKNWSGNIKNKNIKKYLFPKNINELKQIILKAKNQNNKIRVAGSKHSMSPVVCNSDEKNLLLINLKKFKLDDNILINHEEMTVEVNAGFKMATLVDELNKYNYFLMNQPASPVFTIGGICSIPVHGGRIGGNIISDSVEAITFIDENGEIKTKTSCEEDFNIYRLNFGMMGVIIKIKFKIHKMDNLIAIEKSYFNIFYCDPETKEPKLKNIIIHDLENLIKKSISPNLDKVEYNHCFLDYHNNALQTINWVNTDYSDKIVDVFPDVTKVTKLGILEFLLGNIDKGYRNNKKLLSILGKVGRHNISYNVEKNMDQDRDMYWMNLASRVFYMGYFIPVYDENDKGSDNTCPKIKLDNMTNAIEFTMKKIIEFKEQKKKFMIDIFSDIRFVSSSDKSRLSPTYSSTKKIFMCLEISCMAFNIKLNSNKIKFYNKELNKDFRSFYYDIEQKWISLGGIPHFGKMFGFKKDGDPFDKEFIQNIYDSETKETLKKYQKDLFTNEFINDLVN